MQRPTRDILWCHPGIQQFLVEGSAGVLESTVAVEHRVCIRIFQNSFIKRVKNQLVVISVTNNIADDSPVTQVENRTQIELVDNWTFIPLELRYIGQPLFVGMPRPEFPVQTILCCCLRIRELEQGGSAAVRQQSNQQPSGLLVSPRWSTAGKVYRETAIVYLVFRFASHRIYHCRILRQMIILKAEITQPENFRPVGIHPLGELLFCHHRGFFSPFFFTDTSGAAYITPRHSLAIQHSTYYNSSI